MNTPQWIKYDGSDKQIAEINDSVMRHGFILRNKYGSISPVIKQPWHVTLIGDRDTTHYLICRPHPYADLIDIWRLSGCRVYVRITEYELHKHGCREYQVTYTSNGDTVLVTCKPDWNIPGAEYRLTPFED